MFLFFKISFRNIIKNKSRTLVLGFAIGGIAFLMTVLLALVSGIKKTMIQNGTALLTGHVNIGGFYKVSPSSAMPLITEFEKLKLLAQTEIPEASLIIDRMKAYGKIISESDTIQVPIWGVDYDQEKTILGKLELAEANEYIDDPDFTNNKPASEDSPATLNKSNVDSINSKDSAHSKESIAFNKGNLADISQSGTIVLFASQAKKLKIRVGDMVTVSMPTYRNMSNTMDVKLVAVLKDLGLMSQFSSFMNTGDTKNIYKIKSSVTGQIMIFLKNINDVPVVEERVRRMVAKAGFTLMEKEANPFFLKFDRVSGESWTGQRIDVTTWEDETSFLKWILQLLSALTFGLISILLIVVVIGLMNSLWMSIRERTFEIGTLRAIGLQKYQVFIMILLESFMLTFMSILAGTTLGFIFTFFLNQMKIPLSSDALKIFFMSNSLTFDLSTSELTIVFSVMLGFLTLGSLIPTWQAARLKPVVAMQTN